MKNEDKISFYTFIFSFSLFFVFFSLEGSFLIRSIVFPIFLIILYTAIQKKQIKIDISMKYFFALESLYLFSSMINIIKYDCSVSVLLQTAYQFIIFLWFACIIQGEPYNKRELNFYMDSYIVVCFLCSIYILYGNLVLGKYTSGIIGFFGYKIGKNFFGAFLCLGPLFGALKFLYGKRKKIRYAFLTATISLAVMFTNSRGAMLALITSLVLMIIQYNYNNKKISKSRMLITLFCIILFFLCLKPLLNMIPSWMYRRYFINSYKDSSNTDRVLRWKNAFNGILAQPLFGFGPGIFSMIPKYQVTEMGKTISNATYAHNTYLDVMVNGGIVGTLLFLMIIISCLKKLVHHNKIFLPLILNLIISSGILGAGKSVYFWNTIIFFRLFSGYVEKHPQDTNIFC